MLVTTCTSAHAVQALLDSKKGSLTNRVDCAKEHVKNDLKTGVQIGVPAAGVAVVALKKPGLLKTLAVKTGEFAGKAASALGNGITKIAPKAGTKVSAALANAAGYLSKNAYKAGAIGLIAAGGLYVLNKLLNHAETKGRIDQKYNDTGAIENATKHLVLNA